jgi:hypothetical protein
MSMWKTSVESARVGLRVIHNEGVAALMKVRPFRSLLTPSECGGSGLTCAVLGRQGSITFSLKRVADWASRFLFSVMAEDWLYKGGDPVSFSHMTRVLSRRACQGAS